MATKIYQVNEKHFYLSNGTDYLSAISPFDNGKAFKKLDNALMVAQNRYEELKSLHYNGFISGKGKDFIATIQTPHFRAVITIEEITLI